MEEKAGVSALVEQRFPPTALDVAVGVRVGTSDEEGATE